MAFARNWRDDGLPEEIIAQIAHCLDDRRVSDDIRAERGADAIRNLQNFRLANKTFRDAGAGAFFSHVVVPLSRNSASSAPDDVLSQPSVATPAEWGADLISVSLEHVPRLIAEGFAHHVRTMTFRICMAKPVVAEPGSQFQFDADFDKFINLNTVRVVVQDLPPGWEDDELNLELLLLESERWMRGIENLIQKIQRPLKFCFTAPDWHDWWLEDPLNIRAVEILIKASRFRPETDVFDLFGNADSRNKVQSLSLEWESQSRPQQGFCSLHHEGYYPWATNLTGMQLPELRELRYSFPLETGPAFDLLKQVKGTLEVMTFDNIPTWFEADEDWKRVFECLNNCNVLSELNLHEVYLKLPEDARPPLRMLSLRKLKLTDMAMDSEFLTHLIRKNNRTVTSVEFRSVNLNHFKSIKYPSIPATQWEDPRWITVFEALLSCENLEYLALSDLQQGFVAAEQTFSCCAAMEQARRMQWFDTVKFPDRVRLILASKNEDITQEFETYIKLGELIQMVISRKRSWDAVSVPGCERWLRWLASRSAPRARKETRTKKRRLA